MLLHYLSVRTPITLHLLAQAGGQGEAGVVLAMDPKGVNASEVRETITSMVHLTESCPQDRTL